MLKTNKIYSRIVVDSINAMMVSVDAGANITFYNSHSHLQARRSPAHTKGRALLIYFALSPEILRDRSKPFTIRPEPVLRAAADNALFTELLPPFVFQDDLLRNDILRLEMDFAGGGISRFAEPCACLFTFLLFSPVIRTFFHRSLGCCPGGRFLCPV